MEEDEIITPQQFDEQIKELTMKTVLTLAGKASEYATQQNRYHNFVLSAKLISMTTVAQLTIPQTIWALCTKHISSCADIIRHITLGKKFKTEYIDEKFGDFVNYLYLLWIYIRTKYSIEEDAN